MALSLLLCLHSVVGTASAAEQANAVVDGILEEYGAFPIPDGFERIDYSRIVAGDSIVITDDNGHILEVRPNDASTFSVAGGTVAISSLGGAIGAGSITIPGAALPILSLLLACGVVIYGEAALQAMGKVINGIWNSTSSAVKYELEDIVNNDDDNPEDDEDKGKSFILSALATSELVNLLTDQFFDDNGVFVSRGLTFDASNCLAYDYSAQRVYGNVMPSVYDYKLTSSPTSLAGTGLSISIANSPVAEFSKALQVHNSATGATLTFTNDSINRWLSPKDCSVLYTTAPVIETITNSDGDIYYRFGFWILNMCELRMADTYCPDHAVKYESYYAGEPDDITNNFDFVFTNTGVNAIDNVVFTCQGTAPAWDNEWHYYKYEDDSQYISSEYSALELAASAVEYSQIIVGDALTPPEPETELKLAPQSALNNANYLTQNGAMGYGWTQPITVPSVNPDSPEADPDPDDSTNTDNSSFWQKLWTKLQEIIDEIKEIPDKIEEWGENIETAIEEIPSKFETWINDVKTAVEELPSKFETWINDIKTSIQELPSKFETWFSELKTAIANIPGKIQEWLDNAVQWIKDGVLGAIKAAFIPDEAFFTDYFRNLQNSFENRFGVLTYPISVLFRFLNTMLNIGEQEPIFSWNSWYYDGTEVIAAGSYNLSDLVEENETLGNIYNIYLVIVDSILVFFFLSFILRKYRSIIGS